MTSLNATVTFTSWDEQPGWGDDAPLPRVASATVAFAYSGGIEATGDARLVLHYTADGSGVGHGFEMVTGTKDGEEGTFVLEHLDRFTAEGVSSTTTVVEGSGTGAFAGLSGASTHQLGEGTKEWEWSV